MRIFAISFAIVFGFISIAPNLQGAQWLNFGKVLEHYNNHQSGSERFTSFITFLKSHYFENHPTSSDEKQMPFKSTSFCKLVVVFQKLDPAHIALFPLQPSTQKDCFGEPNHIIQNRTISIWNPPRLC